MQAIVHLSVRRCVLRSSGNGRFVRGGWGWSGFGVGRTRIRCLIPCHGGRDDGQDQDGDQCLNHGWIPFVIPWRASGSTRWSSVHRVRSTRRAFPAGACGGHGREGLPIRNRFRRWVPRGSVPPVAERSVHRRIRMDPTTNPSVVDPSIRDSFPSIRTSPTSFSAVDRRFRSDDRVRR